MWAEVCHWTSNAVLSPQNQESLNRLVHINWARERWTTWTICWYDHRCKMNEPPLVVQMFINIVCRLLFIYLVSHNTKVWHKVFLMWELGARLQPRHACQFQKCLRPSLHSHEWGVPGDKSSPARAGESLLGQSLDAQGESVLVTWLRPNCLSLAKNALQMVMTEKQRFVDKNNPLSKVLLHSLFLWYFPRKQTGSIHFGESP